jgi:hypothetical protein
LSRKALDVWGCAADEVMRLYCHHLIGDPICFPFVDIARLADLEFRLQTGSFLLAALAAFATRRRVIAAGAGALK